jgi:predicted TIM-barrel fold metal-dependent hydrolase
VKIIDAQVHIWRQTVMPTTGKHRKVSQVTAEEMLKEMDEAGVDAALIHPPMSWDPTSQDMALEAAKKYPDRYAVMGQFDPKNPANKALIPTGASSPA